MRENIEKSLRRWLKRKVKITLGLTVSFMITGTVGFAEFKIEDIEGGKKLTGTNNESVTDYNSKSHNGITLNEFKEIHIDVNEKPGLKTWSGRFNLKDTDLYINVTGNGENLDGIHLTNHGPNIVLNKYVANIDAPISDALNISRDCTHPSDAPIPYADINYLEATVKQGHGIRANSTISDGKTVIRINKLADIKISGKGYTAVYAGCDEILRDSSKGKGEIYLNGASNIELLADKTSGIWAGRNGYIEVGDVAIVGEENNDVKGIVANDKSINGFIFGGKNKYGSTVLLKGDNVKVYTPNGKAIYADSQYAKISSKDNKEIFYDIKGDIEASNKGTIDLNLKDNSTIKGKITANDEGKISLKSDKQNVIYDLTGISAKNKSTVDIEGTGIDVKNSGEKDTVGILSDKSILNLKGQENINIKINSKEKSYGILGETDSNINIKGTGIFGIESVGEKETYGIVLTNHAVKTEGNNTLTLGTEDEKIKNVEIKATSNNKEAFGILTRDSELTINGDTNIVATGREINPDRVKEMTEEQLSFANDILIKGNNTIGKIFTTFEDGKVYTGAVNQGIRANNSLVNFNGNLDVASTDIAMTSIGKNSNITVNGNSNFTGNDYYLQLGADTSRLISKPVVQALDGGNITLNGDAWVASIEKETAEEHIANVGLYAHGYTDKENEGLTSTIKIFGNTNISSDIATMASKGGNIYINQYDDKEKSKLSNVFINGDIVVGENSEIKISGKDVNISGDVIAGNGGEVTIDLTSKNSNFTGRVDDYFDMDKGFGTEENSFRDDKYKIEIGKEGTITFNMDNGAMWKLKGQSYINNLNFGANGGRVDLQNSSLSIETISGKGTFNIGLNSEDKKNSTMLYIYNAKEDNLQQTVIVNPDDIKNLKVGEEIRFATLGKNAKDKNLSFEVKNIKEEGIKDIGFDTKNKNYDLQDKENEVYNGESVTTAKPGDEFIDKYYTDGENWFLSRTAEEKQVNDIGQTIIEMSKSNYASAVYMDNLNKRLGDMTFAQGNEGYWVRVRNDRVGEDEEYRLHNNMTQLGYDKSYPMEEGKGTEYRGLAFEYSKSDMEYKNIIGSADVDRLALWAYDTRMYNNGFYSDYVFRFGRISSDFDIRGRETGNKVTGDYDNLFAGVSAEFGKRYDISEKAYFEPQIQLQYTYIDDVDYTTNQNTKVEYSDINSLIGRVGFRLGYDYYKENSKDNTIYLKADANHEFLGNQDIKAVDLTGELNERYHNDDTWYDVGIGTAKDLSEDLHIYADVERQFGHKDNSWQFNLGFRWKF